MTIQGNMDASGAARRLLVPFIRNPREVALAALIVVVTLLVGLRAPVFLAPHSLHGLLTDAAILIMLACAQTLVIMTRGIDLSVASALALSGMLVSLTVMAWPEAPLLLVIGLATLCGIVMGAINAALISGLGLPPIVVTLGTMGIYRGLIYVLSGGEWVSSHELPQTFLQFPLATLFGVSHLIWLAVATLFAAWLFMAHSRLGREIRALGGNPSAAGYVGIDERRIIYVVYIVSGAMSGLAGYLWVARYAIAYTQLAFGYELQVVAACVIGGVSIAGGVGSVAGAALGGIFLVVIYNALPLIGVSPFVQQVIVGAAILVAVVVNSRGERQRGKLILPEARRAVSPRTERQGQGSSV